MSGLSLMFLLYSLYVFISTGCVNWIVSSILPVSIYFTNVKKIHINVEDNGLTIILITQWWSNGTKVMSVSRRFDAYSDGIQFRSKSKDIMKCSELKYMMVAKPLLLSMFSGWKSNFATSILAVSHQLLDTQAPKWCRHLNIVTTKKKNC